MEITTKSPYELGQMVFLDKTGAEHLLVAMKATYAIGEDGRLTVAEEQKPLEAGDLFYDDPATSSIQHEAELGPAKVATDVVLHGHARAPKAGTRKMEVSFRVGQLEKKAVVFGQRLWHKSFLGAASFTDPEPFEAVPLLYENAYGGRDETPDQTKHHAEERRNPVGRGFRSKGSHAPWADQPLAQIEDARKLIKGPDQRVTPAGFGFVGRSWEPRAQYAGTYDEKWIEERLPILPEDFDERFHTAASPGLVAPGHLSGGEAVEVLGCTSSGRLAFELPRLVARARIRLAGRDHALDLPLNTVLVDADAHEVRLQWKGQLRVHGLLPRYRKTECWVEGDEP